MALRILLLEDDEADAELELRHLRKAGLDFSARRVANREEFVAALASEPPELILADYSLPSFDGLAALAIVRETAPEVPFIFVTGVMGEEFAIETLHQGAADYVLKGHLTKLAPAVTRALQEAEDRRMRRQAEQELAESEERFRKVAESALDGLLILDQDGATSFANGAVERIFGYPLDELMGRNLHETLVPAAAREPARLGWQQFVKTGEGPVVGHTFETTALRKSGEEFPVELSVSSVLIRHRWHAIGIARDITERKRAEAARTELAAIVESSSDAIVGATLDGVITTWNRGAEAMYGYTAEEMIGQPATALCPPDRLAEIQNFLAQLRNGVGISHYETVRLHKDGHPIDVALSLSPIRSKGGLPVGVSTIARDITERKAAERALQRSNRFLRTLSRCNETLVRATDEADLLREMCRVVVEVGEFALAWVGYAQDDEAKTVRPVAWFGANADTYIAQLNITWGDTERGKGPTGQAIRLGEIQFLQDVSEAPNFKPWRPLAAEYGYRSSIAVPLKVGRRVIGAINIYAAEAGIFTPEEVGLLAELGSDLAYGIAMLRGQAEQRESTRKLEKSLEDTIQAIATTIEARDPYTAGHQRRVAQLAAAIAREMGLAADRVIGVQRGAEIHDIGKIYVPSEILNRPGRLSAVEFDLIKTHARVGYDIIKDIDFPWPVREMILQHHERLDGSGYPNGLKGGGIVVEARILAVADVVDAMVSHRPYRAALGHEAALGEIERNRGRLYDAQIVDCCLSLFRENRFAFA